MSTGSRISPTVAGERFRLPATSWSVSALATFRGRDLCNFPGATPRDSNRRAGSRARLLRPSERPVARLMVRHVSDHADEVDGTIAFASRGVDASAFAKATKRNLGRAWC